MFSQRVQQTANLNVARLLSIAVRKDWAIANRFVLARPINGDGLPSMPRRQQSPSFEPL